MKTNYSVKLVKKYDMLTDRSGNIILGRIVTNFTKLLSEDGTVLYSCRGRISKKQMISEYEENQK